MFRVDEEGVQVRSEEFDKYRIEEQTSITFCLREFRALLAFAESVNMDLTMQFETSGRPVVFILNNLRTFEANLVMSTLSLDDVTQCERATQNHSTSEFRKRNSETSDASIPTPGTTSKRARHNFLESSSASDELLFNFPQRNDTESIDLIRANPETDIDTQIPLPIAASRESVPPISLNKESDGISVTFKDTEELNGPEIVPKSPTAVGRLKKVRTVFKRCFEATFNPKNVTGSSHILAANSDTED